MYENATPRAARRGGGAEAPQDADMSMLATAATKRQAKFTDGDTIVNIKSSTTRKVGRGIGG